MLTVARLPGINSLLLVFKTGQRMETSYFLLVALPCEERDFQASVLCTMEMMMDESQWIVMCGIVLTMREGREPC